jgi:hypothetical protein
MTTTAVIDVSSVNELRSGIKVVPRPHGDVRTDNGRTEKDLVRKIFYPTKQPNPKNPVL